MRKCIKTDFPSRPALSFGPCDTRDPAFPLLPLPPLSLFLFLARDALLQAYENGTISVTLSAPFRCISRPNYMPAMQNSLFSPAIARRPALTSRMFCPVNYNGDFVNWVRHVRKRVIAAIPLIPETDFDLRPLTCFFQPLAGEIKSYLRSTRSIIGGLASSDWRDSFEDGLFPITVISLHGRPCAALSRSLRFRVINLSGIQRGRLYL